jgi:uncharacterized protein YPO0396
MYENGGHRIGAIKGDIARLEEQRDEKMARSRQYGEVVAALGLTGAVDVDTFDANYAAVAAWIDDTHLGNRLVYYRVRSNVQVEPRTLHPQSLARKLQVRDDSPFYLWLDAELARRFDYACCDSMEQFRREKLAVTRNGQIKAGGERHEKDDRSALDDRSRYVLGWSNAAKIAALAKQERDLATRVLAVASQISALKNDVTGHEKVLGLWRQLAFYANFAELDWQPLVGAIDQLQRERDALAASSDVLRTLQEQFDALGVALQESDDVLHRTTREHAAQEEKLSTTQQARDDCAILVDATPEAAHAAYFPMLAGLQGEAALTIESCDKREKELRDDIQARLDAHAKTTQRLRDAIISAMRGYITAWPMDTREADATIEAAGEFKRMLDALQADDLPRFAERFKVLLNENTIREIAGFQSQLKRERETIRTRIDTINSSLQAIDYNPNRYIALEAETNLDADLRDFQQDLRSCTEGALTGSNDEAYSEAKFLQVKRIIERFRGREGSTEMDKRWTRKVTDVRNWFVFSASERWREDDREHEH